MNIEEILLKPNGLNERENVEIKKIETDINQILQQIKDYQENFFIYFFRKLQNVNNKDKCLSPLNRDKKIKAFNTKINSIKTKIENYQHHFLPQINEYIDELRKFINNLNLLIEETFIRIDREKKPEKLIFNGITFIFEKIFNNKLHLSPFLIKLGTLKLNQYIREEILIIVLKNIQNNILDFWITINFLKTMEIISDDQLWYNTFLSLMKKDSKIDPTILTNKEQLLKYGFEINWQIIIEGLMLVDKYLDEEHIKNIIEFIIKNINLNDISFDLMDEKWTMRDIVIMIACKYEKVNIIKFLFNKYTSADKKYLITFMLKSIIKFGKINTFNFFLKEEPTLINDADLFFDVLTIIIGYAKENNHVEGMMLSSLVMKNQPINNNLGLEQSQVNKLLCAAIESKNATIVKLLLSKCNFNFMEINAINNNSTLWENAISSGSQAIINLIFTKMKEKNIANQEQEMMDSEQIFINSLQMAVKNNNELLINFLFNKGINFACKDNHNNSLLHLVNTKQTAKLLLKLERNSNKQLFDKNDKNIDNQTAFDKVNCQENSDWSQILLPQIVNQEMPFPFPSNEINNTANDKKDYYVKSKPNKKPEPKNLNITTTSSTKKRKSKNNDKTIKPKRAYKPKSPLKNEIQFNLPYIEAYEKEVRQKKLEKPTKKQADKEQNKQQLGVVSVWNYLKGVDETEAKAWIIENMKTYVSFIKRTKKNKERKFIDHENGRAATIMVETKDQYLCYFYTTKEQKNNLPIIWLENKKSYGLEITWVNKTECTVTKEESHLKITSEDKATIANNIDLKNLKFMPLIEKYKAQKETQKIVTDANQLALPSLEANTKNGLMSSIKG